MKSLKQLSLALLAAFCWLVVSVSGAMLEPPTQPTFWNFYIYPAMLIASVIYLHWLLRAFVMPLSSLPPEQQRTIKRQLETKHSKPTIRLGYLILGFYMITFFLEGREDAYVPNFAFAAVFLIGLGTLAEARALIQRLLKPNAKSAKPEQEVKPTCADEIG